MEKVKIGIFGAGRGIDIAQNLMLLDCELTALCDFNEKRRNEGLKKLGKDVAAYDDFDKFIEHDMDAVVIANYFHEHTPYAIKCFEKNIHVFCECISNGNETGLRRRYIGADSLRRRRIQPPCYRR